MAENTLLNYCPKCGGDHFHSGDFKPWTCPDCGFVFFQNTAAAAGALILNNRQQLLMVQRAKDPSKGKWGIPGGFIDGGETAEHAVTRECKEEIGMSIHSLSYLCCHPNRYDYGGLSYQTLDLYFTAEFDPSETPKALDEVAAIQWFDLEAIQQDQVAFPSCWVAIQSLIKAIQR